MTTTAKTKTCRFCGKVLTDEDPIGRKQCTECSIKRSWRWHELQAEAKRKFHREAYEATG